MNNKDLKKIMDVAKSITVKQGEGAIFHLGSAEANLGVERWSTGIVELDNAIGGGMPKGRQIEIFGQESTAKTSLAYHLCAQHPICLYIPAEGTFDPLRAKSFGNTPKQMLVYRNCKYAEDIINKILDFARAGIPLIVVDSVPGMQCKSEYDQVEKDAEKQPQYGQLSRLFSRTMKNIEDTIERTGTTIIWVNQVRAKINASAFGEQDDSPGGKAFKHYISLRIKTYRREWINVPNKNPASSSTNERCGLIQKIKILKSKVCAPQEERELPMFFLYGYVSFDDLQEKRKIIMKANNEKYKKKKEDEENENWDDD